MNNSGKKLIVLNEVDSTNNYAKQLIVSNAAEEGTVVLAHYQNSGRGQQGNYWESEPGKNLLCSIILFPDFLPVQKQFLISKIVCLGLFDFLSTETKNIEIKWPNDIYIGSKKIAGILIENALKGKTLDSSVLGIGMNLNQEKFTSNAPNPISLKQITGNNYNIEKAAKLLLKNIFYWYEKLKAGETQEINLAYFSNLYRKNEWNCFKKENKLFEARITGIGEFGQLHLENKLGETLAFMFKEVEFIN